jgi:hypothetical protein
VDIWYGYAGKAGTFVKSQLPNARNLFAFYCCRYYNISAMSVVSGNGYYIVFGYPYKTIFTAAGVAATGVDSNGAGRCFATI